MVSMALIEAQAYRRALRNVGPSRSVSGASDHSAHASIVGGSLAASNSEGREHVGYQLI